MRTGKQQSPRPSISSWLRIYSDEAIHSKQAKPILARQHGIKKAKETEAVGKLYLAFLRRADESTLGRAVVEAAILLAASQGNASQVLREAAEAYKVDVAAITAKVKQEFTTKEKAKTEKKNAARQPTKAPGKTLNKAAA